VLRDATIIDQDFGSPFDIITAKNSIGLLCASLQ
jgi:hypothetical protein